MGGGVVGVYGCLRPFQVSRAFAARSELCIFQLCMVRMLVCAGVCVYECACV